MVTKEQAMTAKNFYFTINNVKNKHFGEQRHCRRNGKTKTWKRSPDRFKTPVKYGLYEFWYITEENCQEFTVID